MAKQLIEQHELGDESQKDKILEKLEKAEDELTKSEQSVVSLSDPEARFMENTHRGWTAQLKRLADFGNQRCFDPMDFYFFLKKILARGSSVRVAVLL